MYLTINKRFEFSSSHRLRVSDWSDERNYACFGREASSAHGHGHNYEAFFAFHGPVDEKTGMMVNVADIKERVKTIIDGRYDHKFLNTDTKPFDNLIPTPENVSGELLKEARPLFEGTAARPVVCHLRESPTSEATAYDGGKVERHLWMDFSAARRTCSPHLTGRENEQLFGRAAAQSGHGHHYRLRVTLHGKVDIDHGMIFPEMEGRTVLGELHDQFDHRNLSLDLPHLRSMPMTTEMLTRYFYLQLKERLPVKRVRLFENEHFFAECQGEDKVLMGIGSDFHAAHRLHSPLLSVSDNLDTYGKCNNPNGHGHLYRVECTMSGDIDNRSGTLYNLGDFNRALESVLDQWNYRHLDMDTDDFNDKTTTGENIISVLWSKLSGSLGDNLYRLRLWETPNNRFTLRRTIEDKS